VPTPKKESIVADVQQRMQEASGLVVISFTGLSVPAITDLRMKLRQADAAMMVAKNRLVKLAIAGTAAEPLAARLTGPNAFVFCRADVPPVVKALADVQKETGGIELQASFLDGVVYDQRQTAALATVPSRPELLSQLVGALESPVSGLVFTLQGIINEFVYTLDDVAEKKAA